MAERFAYDVFLSHNSIDKAQAGELANRLKKEGLRVWFDEWNIKPGDDIYLVIERGLESSRVQVLCLSPAALGSAWVMLERSTVLFRDPTNADRRFIPLLLADCDVPDALRRYKHIDYRSKSNAAFDELLAVCRPKAEFGERPSTIKSGKESTQLIEKEPDPLALFDRIFMESNHFNQRAINSIVVSPDNTWMAAGTREGLVQIWDMETGQCRTALSGHKGPVLCVSITPDGKRILSASEDRSVCIWDTRNQESAKLGVHINKACAVIAYPDNVRALSGGLDGTIRIWDLQSKSCVYVINSGSYSSGGILSAAINGQSTLALSAHLDGQIRLWDLETHKCVGFLSGHSGPVRSIQITQDGRFAISGSNDTTVKIWDLESQTCIRTLEGHQSHVQAISVSGEENLIASAGSGDSTVRLWDLGSGTCLQIIRPNSGATPISLTFSSGGSRLLIGAIDSIPCYVYRITDARHIAAVEATRRYVNAKVVLIGEGAVGKTSLAYRLIEDRYVIQDRTHGMNVWPLDLPPPRTAFSENKKTECEALLWDLAGQEDYRLIHRLFLDETALALLLVNPQKDDPFADAGDWLKALETSSNDLVLKRSVPRLLILSQNDVGGTKVSDTKLERFREQYGFAGWLVTSSKTGQNCSDSKNEDMPSNLKQMISDHIPWGSLPCTSTPRLLAEIKTAVMTLRDSTDIRLLRFHELNQRLGQALPKERFGEADVRTAITLLGNHGLVRPLKFGDLILLRPDLLNGYAAAIIRAARAHKDEIGCLMEAEIYEPGFDFTGVDRLKHRPDEELLLRALVQTFLNKSLCIAEETPQGRHLIFPSQYRREKDIPSDPDVFVSYTFGGEWQTVWTTLVVRLWYSHEFKHRELWRNAAEFQSRAGQVLGLKIDNRQGEGQATINLFFDAQTPDDLKVIFIEYVHQHLAKYASGVKRNRRYVCNKCNHPIQDLAAVRRRFAANKTFITCQDCDGKVPLIDFIEQHLKSDPVARKILSMDDTATRELETQALEQILVGHMMAVCGQANQIFRLVPMQDYGIDGEIEFRDDTGNPSGKKIYVQLRSENYFIRKRKNEGQQSFEVKDTRHFDFWINQSVDVYLVIRQKHHQSEHIHWMNVSNYFRNTEFVPSSQTRKRIDDPSNELNINESPDGLNIAYYAKQFKQEKIVRQITFRGDRLNMQAVWELRDTFFPPRSSVVGHILAVCEEANQIFRTVTDPVSATDGEIEFRDNKGNPSGKKIYVQFKSDQYYLQKPYCDGHQVFELKNPRHFDCWVKLPADVYLVVRQKDHQSDKEKIYCMNISNYLRRAEFSSSEEGSSRQIVFRGDHLDTQMVWRLRENFLP